MCLPWTHWFSLLLVYIVNIIPIYIDVWYSYLLLRFVVIIHLRYLSFPDLLLVIAVLHFLAFLNFQNLLFLILLSSWWLNMRIRIFLLTRVLAMLLFGILEEVNQHFGVEFVVTTMLILIGYRWNVFFVFFWYLKLFDRADISIICCFVCVPILHMNIILPALFLLIL